jgi:putative tryptophan/tyrosine transport system substrate-binding protein
MMRRRAFIALLGGAAVWPLAARAQQSAMPVHRLQRFIADPRHALVAWGVDEIGFVEGRNVV